MASKGTTGTAVDWPGVCMPHSTFCEPAQRPDRSSCPSVTGLVQGQQPMEG